jgi:hypothetical protein
MREDSRATSYYPIFTSILAGLIPIYFFIRYPVSIPFVDDWVLLPWIVPGEEVSVNNYLSGINGHQQLIVKLFLQIYAVISSYNLYLVGFIGISIAIICSILFGFDLLRFSAKTPSFMILISVSLIILNLRQFQNYFMIISIPWIFSLFCIFSFSFLFLRRFELGFFYYKIPLFLAPFCNGLGTSFLLAILLVEFLLKFFKKFNFKYFSISDLILIITSLFLSEILPKIFFESSNSISSLFVSGFLYLIQNPLDSLGFFLLLVGQIFVSGWSKIALSSGIVLGFFLILLFIILIRLVKFSEIVLVGYIFALTFFVFNFTLILTRLPALGVIGSNEPRYTSATLLFICSIIILLLNSKFKINYRYLIVYFALFTIAAGNSIGVAYLKDRSLNEIEIKNCFRTKDLSSCKEIYFSLVMVDSKTYFDTTTALIFK